MSLTDAIAVQYVRGDCLGVICLGPLISKQKGTLYIGKQLCLSIIFPEGTSAQYHNIPPEILA
jgi:hypothetical protein